LDISIAIPVYNEAANLEPLHAELTRAMEALGNPTYEVIYVDDGSSDGSREVLRRIRDADPHVRLLFFRRNFGQTAALSAGLSHTTGDIVLTMDSDLQNDPADIPRLLAEMEKGFDVVSGWRKSRQDTLILRRLPSLVANYVIRRTTNVRIHDYGCMLKAYRGDIARGLRLYGEMHRFIPAIAWDLGASVTEIVVNHRPRISGTSKYGISRAIRVVLDLLTVKFLSRFATRPLHVFGVMGMAVGGIGSAMLGWLGFQKFMLGMEIGGRPALLISVMLVVTGVQLVTMGLLAEMLVRTYHESQGKPTYVISQELPARQSVHASSEVRLGAAAGG